MEAWQQAVPLRGEFGGQRSQLRVGPGRAQHIASRDRMGFHRDEVQQARACRVGAPRLPGCQEIEAQAEAGFENPPLGLPAPGLGQAAAAEENMARLSQCAGFGVINVVEAFAPGNAVGAPGNRLTPRLRALRVGSPTPFEEATPAARRSRFCGVSRRRGGRQSRE